MLAREPGMATSCNTCTSCERVQHPADPSLSGCTLPPRRFRSRWTNETDNRGQSHRCPSVQDNAGVKLHSGSPDESGASVVRMEDIAAKMVLGRRNPKANAVTTAKRTTGQERRSRSRRRRRKASALAWADRPPLLICDSTSSGPSAYRSTARRISTHYPGLQSRHTGVTEDSRVDDFSGSSADTRR